MKIFSSKIYFCKTCGIKINDNFIFGTAIEFKDGFYCSNCANLKIQKILIKEETGI